jgi:hypothetical protein
LYYNLKELLDITYRINSITFFCLIFKDQTALLMQLLNNNIIIY